MVDVLTVQLRKTDVAGLLAQWRTGAAIDSRQVSPAALQAAKQWAIAATLLDEQGLTPEGQLVATKDPYLEATVTDWLIHFNLSQSDRSLWKYIVYDFLPEHSSFTQDELLNCCIEGFKTASPDQLKKDLRLILRTYTEPQAIVKNKFLIERKKQYSTGNPELSNPYTVGYILAKIWERDFESQSSVLVDEIIDAKTGLTRALGITREQLRQQLDILEKYDIIEQQSARPRLAGSQPRRKQEGETAYQIIRCWDNSIQLLEKAYENDIATPNQPLMRSLAGILDDDDDIPDFSQLLEWVVRLQPKQAYWLLNVGAIAG